jgi:anti-anti-sigma factor
MGLVDMLRMTVTAGGDGPLISMSGEADMTCIEQIREVLTSQLATGTAYLTIDASELTFADSGAISVLAGTAMTLKGLGGGLILLHPRDSLVRILKILGADQMLTIIQPPT